MILTFLTSQTQNKEINLDCVFKSFPYLKELIIMDCVIPSVIESSSFPQFIETLHIKKCSFNTKIFSYISKMVSLKDLSISKSVFTSTETEFYDDLSKISSLIKLDVSYTSVNTRIFSAIEKMVNLKSLNLNGCQELMYNLNTTEAAKQLSNKRYLEELQWSTCPSPYIINTISLRLTNLKKLNLNSSCLDEQIVSISKNLTNLNHLCLKQTGIKDNIRFSLNSLSNLKSLDVSLCGWAMSRLDQICELKNLEELSITIENIDYKIVNEIVSLKKLKLLNLSYVFASHEIIMYLTRSLTLLNVQFNLISVELSNLTSTNNFIRLHCLPLIKPRVFENFKRKRITQ